MNDGLARNGWRQRSPWTRYVAAAATLVLALATGCDSTPQRIPLTGEVEVRGRNVHRGTIRFEPMSGPGAPTSTQVTENRFQFGTADGPMPGQYRVVVHRFEIDPNDGPTTKAELSSRPEPPSLNAALENDSAWSVPNVRVAKETQTLTIRIDPHR